MLSFSKYLAQKGQSTQLNSGELISSLPGWIEHLQSMLLEFKTKELITQNTFDQCFKGMEAWRSNLEKHVQGFTVSAIDSIYQKLLYVLVNDMTLSPRRLELLQNYPFPPKVSGVSLKAQLVMQDTQGCHVVSQESTTQSLVGSTQGAALKKSINTQLGQIPWLAKNLALLGKKIQDIQTNNPHAEMIWCVKHSKDLLKKLKSMTPQYPLLNDDFPQSQLVQTPRLEIITSSSCCMQCRLIFSALRLHLEALGIHLPIVLYSDSPFNTGEIHGSVYVILSDGNIFNTKLQCNTPGANYQPALPWGNPLNLRNLSTKEQSDWDCLTLMGGLALVDLLKVGVVQEQFNKINPVTYIAPDSLIIYAAEKWLNEKNVPKSLREAIARLNNILANIDMEMLTSWRLAFTEQLHWLLVSELDPNYREHARKYAYATNTNFTLGLLSGTPSAGDQFCDDFSLLWGQLNGLMSGYKKVLAFFLENGHARMPLGCLIGPLSIAMIKNHFEKETADSLLLRREADVNPVDVLSETDSDTVPHNAEQRALSPTWGARYQPGLFVAPQVRHPEPGEESPRQGKMPNSEGPSLRSG